MPTEWAAGVEVLLRWKLQLELQTAGVAGVRSEIVVCVVATSFALSLQVVVCALTASTHAHAWRVLYYSQDA